MRRLSFSPCLIVLLLLFVCPGCNGHKPIAAPDNDRIAIYVVGLGWHTALIIPVAEMSDKHLPVRHTFEQYQYIEVSWGDLDFFKSPEFSWFVTLKAALVPTSGVLHIVGFNGPFSRYYSNSEIFMLNPGR